MNSKKKMARRRPRSSIEPMSVLIQRKQQIDQDIKNIEKQIFELEETYLEETHHYGSRCIVVVDAFSFLVRPR